MRNPFADRQPRQSQLYFNEATGRWEVIQPEKPAPRRRRPTVERMDPPAVEPPAPSPWPRRALKAAVFVGAAIVTFPVFLTAAVLLR